MDIILKNIEIGEPFEFKKYKKPLQLKELEKYNILIRTPNKNEATLICEKVEKIFSSLQDLFISFEMKEEVCNDCLIKKIREISYLLEMNRNKNRHPSMFGFEEIKIK
jgi:hypothetical protein